MERKTLARHCPTLLTLLKAFPVSLELQEPTFKDIVVVYRSVPRAANTACLGFGTGRMAAALHVHVVYPAQPHKPGHAGAAAPPSYCLRAWLLASYLWSRMLYMVGRACTEYCSETHKNTTTRANTAPSWLPCLQACIRAPQASYCGCQCTQQVQGRAHAGHPGLQEHQHQGGWELPADTGLSLGLKAARAPSWHC